MSETNVSTAGDTAEGATSNVSAGQKRARDDDNEDDDTPNKLSSSSSADNNNIGGGGGGGGEEGGKGKIDNDNDVPMENTTDDKGEETSSGNQAAADSAAAPPAPAPTSSRPPPGQQQTQTASSVVSAASAAVASQLSASMGLQGLYSLLSLTATMSSATGGGGGGGSGGGGSASGGTSTGTASMPSSSSTGAAGSGGGGSSTGNTHLLPAIEQVQQAATKSVTDQPPFCHLSKSDSAPQLKIVPDSYRLVCKGGMRGYRMTRGSHGVSEGNYYYEVVILDPPSASEIAQSLPSNVRLGRQLQQDMQEALRAEERAAKAAASSSSKDGEENTNSNKNDGGDGEAGPSSTSGNNNEPPRSKFGAHVRLGWSMRSGDLQAPVGYDRFSFAVRDIGGSKIHSSKRDDYWGGEEFGPGDIVGCAISLVPGGDGGGATGTGAVSNNSDSQQFQGPRNHIRFFKNGFPMGEFVISKGRREGGTAFVIPDGMYYPAISLYMGASVKVNFGPNFVYPPRKLPAGLKFQPISAVCKPPISVEEAIAKVTKEKVFRKSDMQQRFMDLVKAEVDVVQDVYRKQRQKHLEDVLSARKKRNLKTEDLENDEFYDSMDVE